MDNFRDLLPSNNKLIDWYFKECRTLPWRETNDPYHIWISEIILQQTRVDQGLSYYRAFVERFPDLTSLASAPLADVLKQWQGLGYYSRARNLHQTAIQLVENYQGTFPDTYEALIKLKGIGPYTAAAIASISFKKPYAVVDGNVFRVLARLLMIDTPIYTTAGKRLFAEIATSWLDRERPDWHNQAIMEFGALQCLPANPHCAHCPFQEECLAYRFQRVAELPVRQPAKSKRVRNFYYFVFQDQRHTWLTERTQKDIWQHLWEFPLIESEEELSLEDLLNRDEVNKWLTPSSQVGTPVCFDQALSHQLIHATFIPVRQEDTFLLPSNWKTIALDQLDEYPVSRLTEKFINQYII
jgi:A/G-specific adenine glycosylase